MTEEAKENRRAYWRQYYANHKEQHKATMERYWEKKATGYAPAKVVVQGIKYDTEYLKTAFRILCSVFNDKKNNNDTLKGAYEGMRLIGNYIKTEECE